MLIDLHLHTSEFSPCSKVFFEEIIFEAKKKGLDGVCITDHDNMLSKKFLSQSLLNEMLVVIGVEVLTIDGDILVFGVKDLPKEKISALELTNLVFEKGGVSIAAHPFRNNNRGIGENIEKLDKLTLVEGFNGNTSAKNNLKALEAAYVSNKPVIGGSDAHNIKQVGCYATHFSAQISDEKALVAQLLKGNVNPMFYNKRLKKYQEVKERLQ